MIEHSSAIVLSSADALYNFLIVLVYFIRPDCTKICIVLFVYLSLSYILVDYGHVSYFCGRYLHDRKTGSGLSEPWSTVGISICSLVIDLFRFYNKKAVDLHYKDFKHVS